MSHNDSESGAPRLRVVPDAPETPTREAIKSARRRAARRLPVSEHPAEPVVVEPVTYEQPRRRRRWPWVAGGLLLALAGWWGVTRGADAPPVVPVGPAPTGGASGSKSPSSIAEDYETRRLAGDVTGTCALDIEPTTCRAGFGSTPARYSLSEAPRTVETAEIPRGDAVISDGGTAVLVRFQIEGQARRQVAFLVRDGLVVQRVTIGADQAGRSLSEIVKEAR